MGLRVEPYTTFTISFSRVIITPPLFSTQNFTKDRKIIFKLLIKFNAIIRNLNQNIWKEKTVLLRNLPLLYLRVLKREHHILFTGLYTTPKLSFCKAKRIIIICATLKIYKEFKSLGKIKFYFAYLL